MVALCPHEVVLGPSQHASTPGQPAVVGLQPSIGAIDCPGIEAYLSRKPLQHERIEQHR